MATELTVLSRASVRSLPANERQVHAVDDVLEIRATRLSATDIDYLRGHARRRGYPNTSSAVVRFAVMELARRLRAEPAATVRRTGKTEEERSGESV